MTADIHNDSSVVDSSIDHVVSLRHANINHQHSFSVSDLMPGPNICQHPLDLFCCFFSQLFRFNFSFQVVLSLTFLTLIEMIPLENPSVSKENSLKIQNSLSMVEHFNV